MQESRTRITWNYLCEVCEADTWRSGRYFVHELTSEVNSRMKCVDEDHGHARDREQMWQTRRMFGLAACDGRRTRICQRERTDGQPMHDKVEMRMQSKMHGHASTCSC